jgi:hypothetical protein
MTHIGNISNHFDAMHHCLSGQSEAPADSPYIGSVLAKLRPSRSSVAPYVWLIKCVGDPVFCAPNIGTGGYLGAGYSPMFIGSAADHPAMPGFKAPSELLPAVAPERMQERRRLLQSLNPAESSSVGNRVVSDWQELQGRAFELASGSAGRQPFELEREPTSVRDRYGMHPLGQNLLLARRLVEAGVPFVNVFDFRQQGQNWDAHHQNFEQHKTHLLPLADQSLSALIEDLDARGLLDSTLVVAMGEFGRTPKINAAGGRDHWPDCFSVLLAGGGVQGGAVHGASDRIGAFPARDPVTPADLAATIFWRFGIDPASEIHDLTGRPWRVADGQPLRSLFV